MRRIQGQLLLPGDAVPNSIGRARVEVRDVSIQDAPSTVLAADELDDVEVEPGGSTSFEILAPTTDTRRSLALRAQVDAVDRAGQRSAYLTTSAHPVPAEGDVNDMVVRLSKVR